MTLYYGVIMTAVNFTHEDRYIIGLLGILGFVDTVAWKCYLTVYFTIVMLIWVAYEMWVTVKYCHNFTCTMLSLAIGALLYVSVGMVIQRQFVDVKWDAILIIGIIAGLYVNYLSFKRKNKC